MSRWIALLAFPVVPSRAAQRLSFDWIGAIVPVATITAASTYLAAHGVAAADVVASAVTLLRVLAGVAGGGLLASWIAARVVGRAASWRALAGPVLAAAGWAPPVFVGVLLLAHAGGAGAAAALYAGITLLIWGVAAGFGIVAGEAEPEPGRLLVASCFGLGGVLIGLWIALAAPPAPSVQLVPAPVAYRSMKPGDLMLVGRHKAAADGDLLLLREPGSAEAVLAISRRDGSPAAVGEIQVDGEKLQDWNIAGRVFFRFGIDGGRFVGPAEQSPELSRD